MRAKTNTVTVRSRQRLECGPSSHLGLRGHGEVRGRVAGQVAVVRVIMERPRAGPVRPRSPPGGAVRFLSGPWLDAAARQLEQHAGHMVPPPPPPPPLHIHTHTLTHTCIPSRHSAHPQSLTKDGATATDLPASCCCRCPDLQGHQTGPYYVRCKPPVVRCKHVHFKRILNCRLAGSAAQAVPFSSHLMSSNGLSVPGAAST